MPLNEEVLDRRGGESFIFYQHTDGNTHLRECDICVRLSWEINWMWRPKSERDDGDGVSGLSAEVSARREQLGLFMCNYTQNPSGQNQPDWL